MAAPRAKLRRRSRYYLYILECNDGTYYTGYTNNLEKRIREHNNNGRGARYTRSKRPVRLVWSKEYRYFKNAVQEECRIKKLRRWQKEKLINEHQKRQK